MHSIQLEQLTDLPKEPNACTERHKLFQHLLFNFAKRSYFHMIQNFAYWTKAGIEEIGPANCGTSAVRLAGLYVSGEPSMIQHSCFWCVNVRTLLALGSSAVCQRTAEVQYSENTAGLAFDTLISDNCSRTRSVPCVRNFHLNSFQSLMLVRWQNFASRSAIRLCFCAIRSISFMPIALELSLL